MSGQGRHGLRGSTQPSGRDSATACTACWHANVCHWYSRQAILHHHHHQGINESYCHATY